MSIKSLLNRALFLYEALCFPLVLVLTLLSRFIQKKWDIGIGPEPLINNVYHKKALESKNFKVQTYVTSLYFITHEFDKKFVYKSLLLNFLAHRILFISYWFAITRFKCWYIYFNGGPLYHTTWMWKLEPFLLRVAGIKTVVMPYGSDVQLLDGTPNLSFRNAVIKDYPNHRFKYNLIKRRIHLWSCNASHVISGCDWVDTMFHWDTLMLGHFSIEMNKFVNKEMRTFNNSETFKILHAPNHRTIKGTYFIERAVHELQIEGFKIELTLLQKVSNEMILSAIKEADLVIDQLIIGWYAMFSIEAMASGKPVICFLRDDLLTLYRTAGLLNDSEPPLINSNVSQIKSTIRFYYENRSLLDELSEKGKKFVERHHSVEAIGNVFLKINESIMINSTK